MELNTTVNGTSAVITVNGKLSVATSPDLEKAIQGLPSSVTELDLDLTELDYISSAGLRVLVASEKLAQSRGGRMRLLHPADEVKEVFDMTGLIDIFTIED